MAITDLVAVGKMTARVTLRALVAAKDTSHYPVQDPAVLATGVAAFRRDVDRPWSTERFGNGQTSARLETEWVIWYRADMDPEQLDVAAVRDILSGGRVYDILFGKVIRRRQIVLATVAKVG